MSIQFIKSYNITAQGDCNSIKLHPFLSVNNFKKIVSCGVRILLNKKYLSSVNVCQSCTMCRDLRQECRPITGGTLGQM